MLCALQESSSGDEFDARGNPKPKKVKKRTKIDDMKDELTDIQTQIEVTNDSHDKAILKRKFEEKDHALTMVLMEKQIERRVCWVCLHSAPVSKLVKCCGCDGFLEFSHLSCLLL